jgi:hypothetical protein
VCARVCVRACEKSKSHPWNSPALPPIQIRDNCPNRAVIISTASRTLKVCHHQVDVTMGLMVVVTLLTVVEKGGRGG